MRLALILLLTCAPLAPLSAQTLALALEQTWARDPKAASFADLGVQAKATASVAGGLTAGPGVISMGSTGDRLNARKGKQEWEIEFAVPLWRPGQQAQRKAEAQRSQADVDAARQSHRLQVAGELRAAWWALASARSAVALADARITLAQQLEDDVQRRVRAGDLARLDANLARSERLAAQGERLTARQELSKAEQALRSLTGANAPSSLSGETPRAPPAAEHPQIAAALAHEALAQARLRLAQADRGDAPEVALRMVRERGDFNDAYSSVIGFKFSIPLHSGARTAAASAEQRAAWAQAESEVVRARERVLTDVALARDELSANAAEVDLLVERARLSADTLQLSEKSFALGEFDLAAVLRARLAHHEVRAQLERQRVRGAALQSQLLQAQGLLP